MKTLNHDLVSTGQEDNKREVCTRCGKPLTVQDKFCAICGLEKSTLQPKSQNKGQLIAVVIAIFLVVVVLGTNSHKTDTSPHKFEPATLLPGATLQLKSDGGTAVPVVLTREIYKEWMKLAGAKDTVGEQTMVNDGQMLMTPNGTRAKLLESHDLWDGSYNVRILDGPLYGQAVWTSSVFISEDKAKETKTRPPVPEYQPKGKDGDLAVGAKAILYGSVVMETDVKAYEDLKNLLGTSDYVGKYEELALDGRVLNCARGSGSQISRMSVVILDTNSVAGGNVYAKIQITGVLKGEQDAVMRAAGFADEDRNGSSEDCFFLDGQPPNVGYRHVKSVGSIGYIDKDRLYPVDAEGHDLQFINMKSDVNQPSPATPIVGRRPVISTPVVGRDNPNDGLKYVWIPPGTIHMGCSAEDTECSAFEKPLHQVTITKGFWLGQTEVTVAAYKRFVASTGAQMPTQPHFNAGWNNEDMPVNVSWDGATAFCSWAGGRLPTEAEWEYAARGESSGARYGPIDEIAWYRNNSGQKQHEVGQKRANGFGLYDMLGNAFEWVNDWYDKEYYQSSPSHDPAGPMSGMLRVVRGGSWWNDPSGVRVSDRNGHFPSSRGYGDGFRCAGKAFSP